MDLQGNDGGLQKQIDDFIAVDDHAHPLPLGMEAPGDPARPIQEYDSPLPIRMRQRNPEYLDAWTALWGYEHRDFETRHLADLMQKKASVLAREGSAYNCWVLDQVNLEKMVSINIDPSETLPMSRFPWCAFCEWMLWPVTSEPMLGGHAHLWPGTNARKIQELSLSQLPSTIDAYLEQVVLTGLADIRKRGAVGIKFSTPYYRNLSFDDQPKAEADRLYRKGVAAGSLSPPDHRIVQDYIFRALVKEAGRLDLPVQMHTGQGARPYFPIEGANPLLMESVFRDTPGTRFLILHGGWPFVTESVTLTSFPNVYIDFSCAGIYQYPRSLSGQIRQALEWFPEKLMFGTDSYSDRGLGPVSRVLPKDNPLHGWEEKVWMINRTNRQALSLALSGMMADSEISSKTADAYLDMVMRRTATEFHNL
jgi:uncharacterized protein